MGGGICTAYDYSNLKGKKGRTTQNLVVPIILSVLLGNGTYVIFIYAGLALQYQIEYLFSKILKENGSVDW